MGRSNQLPQDVIDGLAARLAQASELRLPGQLTRGGASVGLEEVKHYLKQLLLHDPGEQRQGQRRRRRGLPPAASFAPFPIFIALPTLLPAGVFLERHGSSLTEGERAAFECLRSDYEVSCGGC